MRCLRLVLEDLRREILLHRGSVSCKSSKLIDIKIITQSKLLVGLYEPFLNFVTIESMKFFQSLTRKIVALFHLNR